MRVVARIILLIVAAGAFIYGVPNIMNHWATVAAIDWSNIQNFAQQLPEAWAAMSAIALAVGACLMGLLALFQAILGRTSFICFVVAVIVLGLFIWNIVTKVQANQLTDFMSWLNVAAGFALPLGFSVGTLLLLLPGGR